MSIWSEFGVRYLMRKLIALLVVAASVGIVSASVAQTKTPFSYTFVTGSYICYPGGGYGQPVKHFFESSVFAYCPQETPDLQSMWSGFIEPTVRQEVKSVCPGDDSNLGNYVLYGSFSTKPPADQAYNTYYNDKSASYPTHQFPLPSGIYSTKCQ